MRKSNATLVLTGLMCCLITLCEAQEPFIPKDLNNEPYSPAWVYLPNLGQVFDLGGYFRQDVSFQSVGNLPTITLNKKGGTLISFPYTHEEDSTLNGVARIDMHFAYSSPRPAILKDIVPTHYNFYEQYTPNGITDVVGGNRVIFQDLYPHIDYHIFSNAMGPKFLLTLNPGADPNSIVFSFQGQDSLKVDMDGYLKLYADNKLLVFPEGLAYQQQGQTVIPIVWVPHFQNTAGQLTVHLELGAYDHTLPLMLLIQPLGGMQAGGGGGGNVTPPEWSTYMAGVGYDDAITDLTHDNDGNLYFTGYSRSTNGLPITAGLSPVPIGQDFILGRVNAHYEIQTPETWMTYYGGSGGDAGTAIAYDAANNRLVTCGTSGSPANELLFQGSFAPTSIGYGLVALFDLGGHRLYATRVGTYSDLTPADLDVDAAGNTYVVGYGLLSGEFDIVNPPGTQDYTAFQGSQNPGGLYFDGFVRRYNPDMTLSWSTALGGPDDDEATACAVDNVSGKLYVVGSTSSPNDLAYADCPVGGYNDFPLCNENGGYYQDRLNGSANVSALGQDAFATAFDLNTLHMDWSTYLGSPAPDEGATDVAVDGQGNAYITGFTNMGFCTDYCEWESSHFSGCANGQYFNASPNGYWTHHFIYRFDNHHEMTWGTFIGGGQQEYFGNLSRARVDCDAMGNVYLFGSSNSGAYTPDTPVLPPVYNADFYNQGGEADAPQPETPAMPYDTYIGGFDSNGQLFYSSYFGGYGNDYAGAVDAFNGRVYICGSTAAALNFPTHAPTLPTPSVATTDRDGFLAQIKNDYSIGVDEIPGFDHDALQLYPNPTTGTLTVHADLTGFDMIEVLNPLGQVVLRQTLKNGSATLNGISLAQGTYVVRLLGPNGSIFDRFIKQ